MTVGAGGQRVTAELVERIQGVRSGELPAELLDLATDVVIDGVAVMIAGSTEPSGIGRIVTDWVIEAGGTPEAGIAAGGMKVPAPNAAFANGTMAHALDFDNYGHPRNHPTSPVLPAILALAQKHGMSGEHVLTALVVAYEVQNRLRLASIGLDPGRGFHKPGTTGLMGATAACAWMLDLDATRMAMALGIAGSRVGSLSINTGTMTKSSHSGHAARMGLESAELALRGWTATTEVFDAGGFFDTLLGDRYDASLLLKDFGDPFYLQDPGVGFKKYPCQGWQQRPIDAVLELRSEHAWSAGDVVRVEVDMPPFDFIDRPSPTSGIDGKFSVQFTVSAAILDGTVGIETFSDARRFREDMREFLPKVSLHKDPSISMSSVETLVRLRVELRDGRVLKKTKLKHTGMVGIPLTREQLLGKYRYCAGRVMDPERAELLLSALRDIRSAGDIGTLMGLVTYPQDVGMDDQRPLSHDAQAPVAVRRN